MSNAFQPPEDERIIAAFARVAQSDDGKAILEYLENSTQAQHEANAVEYDEAQLRWGQGAVQALATMSSCFRDARSVLERKRKVTTASSPAYRI
jgi:hypothetical protein